MIHSGHPADDPAGDHPRLRLVTASLPTGRYAAWLGPGLTGQQPGQLYRTIDGWPGHPRPVGAGL